MSEDLGVCEVCGEVGTEDNELDIRCIRTSMYPERYEDRCENCMEDVIICFDCDDAFDLEICREGLDGRWRCIRCWEDICYICNSCDEDRSLENDPCCENCGCCPSCCECGRNRGEIYVADHKMVPQYYGSPPYYGVELEADDFKDDPSLIVECAEELIKNYSNEENLFYVKEDGSLNNGIELCFSPRSIKYWLNFGDTLEEISKVIKEHGGRSYDGSTCGIHVHRGRSDLNDLDISKIIIGLVKLQNYIVKIAQRRCETNAPFDPFTRSYRHNREEHVNRFSLFYKKLKSGDYTAERYQALNLQNSKTIEFRVFKGTLKPSSIIAYVLFCDIFTKWCIGQTFSSLILENRSQLWSNFTEFVESTKIGGKELVEYMRDKEVMPDVSNNL